MKTVRVVNATRGREIAGRAALADSWWTRLRGLIGRPALETGEGLLLVPCKAVHMYGMSHSIDVAFTDADGVVVALYRELAPGARSRWHGRARSALEVPPGTLAETGTEVGDIVQWNADGTSPSGNGARSAEVAR